MLLGTFLTLGHMALLPSVSSSANGNFNSHLAKLELDIRCSELVESIGNYCFYIRWLGIRNFI